MHIYVYEVVLHTVYFIKICINIWSNQMNLTVTSFCANSADDNLVIFFLFFPETGFDISCKLSPVETICMKHQLLFSGKIRKIFQYVIC